MPIRIYLKNGYDGRTMLAGLGSQGNYELVRAYKILCVCVWSSDEIPLRCTPNASVALRLCDVRARYGRGRPSVDGQRATQMRPVALAQIAGAPRGQYPGSGTDAHTCTDAR